MQEVWKDIEGYEGLYQVSNMGRVRSLDRYVERRKQGRQFWKGKMLNPRKRKKGEEYLYVDLTNNTTRKRYSVHRLVASAFLGNYPELEVNHKDENPANNRVENLEWVTHYENMHYNNLFQRVKKPNKKAVNAYDMQGNLVLSFDSIEEASKLGFNRSAISQNINGKNKTSGGYIWKIAE